jgi:peptidoglycan/xylan/chitin deacetylase (PgdA/CDA1 family)
VRPAERPEAPCVRGSADGGRLYLTFDDGPDPTWTPAVLDALAAAQASATFFLIGRAARAHASLVRRVVAGGHEIGNHSYSHRHPWFVSARAARAEVRDGAAAIEDASGLRPRYFRPPHGRIRREMLDAANDSGERTVLWSLSAVDWGPLGRAARIAARLEQARAGDIVLMHDARNRHNRPGETLRVLPGWLAKCELTFAALDVRGGTAAGG